MPVKPLPFVTKPTYVPQNEQRERGKIRMTLVAALSGFEGSLLLADTQETVGQYSKKSIEKVEVCDLQNHPFRFAIGGATTNGNYTDSLQREIVATLCSLSEFDVFQINRALTPTLTDFYATHIWPRSDRDRPEMEYLLIVQPLPKGMPRVFHIAETATNLIVPDVHWRTIGVGNHLADYLFDRMLSSIPIGDSVAQLIAAAVYTAKEVHDNIEDVGPLERIIVFGNDGSYDVVCPSDIEKVQQNIGSINEALEYFFQDAMDVDDVAREMLQPEGSTQKCSQISMTPTRNGMRRGRNRRREGNIC